MKIKKIISIIILFGILLSVAACNRNIEPVSQIQIEVIEKMPNIPPQFKMKDWKNLAIAFDKFAYDFELQGEYLPIIWWDRTRKNFDQDIIGIPSFVGDNRQPGTSNHESITVMSALKGASLVGIDKRNQNGINFIQMIKNYYNIDNGLHLVLNSTEHDTGNTFWYELYPHLLFYILSELYPDEEGLSEIVKETADRWYDAAYIMSEGGKNINFNYNSFNFKTMKPNAESWAEPDGAAGIAWTQYFAYKKFGDEKYLDSSKWGIQFLNDSIHNPYYEMLLPYGAYIAAKLNAEHDMKYDLEKIVNWCFNMDGMSARPGISVTSGKWGEYNVDGLYVCWSNGKEYAFAMNTFSMASPLVPLVRYDQRFARSVGKWLLHAANNARLFYPDEIPVKNQSCPEFMDNYNYVIAYEGLHSSWAGKSPFAMGDARTMGWAGTDFGIYGSTHAGIFGGLISNTNVEKILKIDCLKTDFIRDDAYPTYLYYNPYDEAKTIEIALDEGSKSLYDAVLAEFVAKDVSGSTEITIPADSA